MYILVHSATDKQECPCSGRLASIKTNCTIVIMNSPAFQGARTCTTHVRLCFFGSGFSKSISSASSSSSSSSLSSSSLMSSSRSSALPENQSTASGKMSLAMTSPICIYRARKPCREGQAKSFRRASLGGRGGDGIQMHIKEP